MVGQVGRLGIEDAVVVATTQFDGDFASDGAGHPALGGFAQHQGLGVEPAALVQQAAELFAVHAVLFNRVFVVNAGDEALIGNEQQGQARRFINATALGLDDAVFNLVAHAKAVATADAIGL